MYRILKLLTDKEVDECRRIAAASPFVDGRITNPHNTAKQNEQLHEAQAFQKSSQLLLQAFERCQVVAEAEALQRQRAQAELAARLVQLGPPVDVNAVAVGEVEPQRVEAPARHRDAEAGAVGGILEREEDAGPALLPAKLRDLTLDPDGGQAGEPGGDAAVERAHRVDPAVAVVDRLDFHTGEARSRSRSRSQARSLA